MLPRFVFIIMNNAVIRSSLRNYVEQCFDGLVFFWVKIWIHELMAITLKMCSARESTVTAHFGPITFPAHFYSIIHWVSLFRSAAIQDDRKHRSPWLMLPSLSRTVTFRYLSNGAGWWKLADAINPCRSIRAGWSMVILRCLLVSQLEFFSPNFFSIRK